MATTTHFLQSIGTNGSTTAQFNTVLTVPSNKIAKVHLTSLSVQNTTTTAESVNWVAGLYVVPSGSTKEVLIDAYKSGVSVSTKSHYVIFPTGTRGNSGATVGVQNIVTQNTYNNYDPNLQNVNSGATGFLNPVFYLGSGETLKFMWKQNDGVAAYDFFLRGFYLLEDATS